MAGPGGGKQGRAREELRCVPWGVEARLRSLSAMTIPQKRALVWGFFLLAIGSPRALSSETFHHRALRVPAAQVRRSVSPRRHIANRIVLKNGLTLLLYPVPGAD